MIIRSLKILLTIKQTFAKSNFFLTAMVLGQAFLFITALFAAEPGPDLGNPKKHYVEFKEGILIDWTAGFIIARSRIALPEIINNRKNPNFGKQGTERSLTDARSRAMEEVKERASLMLMSSILDLRLDSSNSIRKKMQTDRELRYRIGELPSNFKTHFRNIEEGFVSIELIQSFRQEGGLYDILAADRYGTGHVPELDATGFDDKISGILIDVSAFPDFKPSLEPRIFTEEGSIIYSPEMVSRREAVERGMASYFKGYDQAKKHADLGSNVFYVVAGGITGKDKGDVFLDASDVQRILGSKSGRRALRRCRVSFILRR